MKVKAFKKILDYVQQMAVSTLYNVVKIVA